MGRGLSDLQKTILRLAHENVQTGKARIDETSGADLFYPQILTAFFGWEQTSRHPDVFWYYHFHKAEIGDEEYNRARASLSRSVKRLADRGLVEKVNAADGNWAGVNLTKEGLAVAEGLTVNTWTKCQTINR